MKKIWLLFLFVQSINISASATDKETDSLMRVYDELLLNYSIQINHRQSRIETLEKEAANATSLEKKYDINFQIYQEYRPFISDLAISFLKKNIGIAKEMGDKNRLNDSKLRLAYLLASIGLYKESVDILDEIVETELPNDLLIFNYVCMEHTYGEMSFYSKDAELSNQYRDVANKFKDLLKSNLPKDNDRYLEILESDYRYQRDYEMALKINDQRLQKVNENSQEYALISFHRSSTYKASGDILSEKKWLLKSSITDLRLGITDNASSWELANLMFMEGDVQRAHKYINYSVNNSKYFNARLRYTQIAEVQAIINNAFLTDKAQKDKQLRKLLFFISLLSLLLLLSLVGIYLQNRRISKANLRTLKANNELNRLNQELNNINDAIKNTNAELSESNQVKEVYIGHFLSLCSLYIDKMDTYRKSVRNKLTSGHQKEVIEDAKSTEFMEIELKEFYKNFDQSFLRLYPDFVNEFNDLLVDDAKIVLKRDELLNTELRIFALIRLGIDNSAKIAELLHYSAKTIYNYRASIKNKSKVSRNDFEDLVKKIGTITK